MKNVFSVGRYGFLALLGILVWPETVSAQFFSYKTYGDTLLGFRKTGMNQGTYELVVNLGSITNFVAIPAGTTVSITRYAPSQLSDAFADGFQNLQWSVSAGFPGSSSWAGYPKTTVWYSLPGLDAATQSQPLSRFSLNAQASVQKRMQGLGQGAVAISSGLGTTNGDNNASLVREPYDPNSINGLTYFIGDSGDPTVGDWGGLVLSPADPVENVTPAPFATPARLDFYQSVPSGYVDPTTGSTGPLAYLVGYFLLAPDGTMTFTRGATNSVPPPPPPAPQISIARSGTISTISVGTTNGATYTLFYTNSSGLSTPVSAWSSSPSTVTGDGSIKSFTDITTDADRVYRVTAQ